MLTIHTNVKRLDVYLLTCQTLNVHQSEASQTVMETHVLNYSFHTYIENVTSHDQFFINIFFHSLISKYKYIFIKSFLIYYI